MGDIKLLTEVPGPRSMELSAAASTYIGGPLDPYGDVWADSGLGALLIDVDGNTFIDLIGGVGCLVAGHSHPRVVDAVTSQAGRFTHTDFSLVPYESYSALAERLTSLCGGGLKAGFFNSGAEAVENAVKIARAATRKSGIICFEGAFHGRTFMAMTLTHREDPYKRGFGPFVPDVYRAPYPGLDAATLQDSVSRVKELLGRGDIAGVIVEPVLGEGGFVVPPGDFLPNLATLCEEAGAVLIADEIQTGYGRTGTFLAIEQMGVRPGLITLGKSIAAGLPLSAVVGEPRWFDALESNALGGTYVGNPVAIAAALAILDVIEEERLLQRAVSVGELLSEGWKRIAGETGAIAEVRGLGAMIGVEFLSAQLAAEVVTAARRSGVLSMRAGREANVIRHLMPLVITDDQVGEALEVFAESVRSAS